MLLLNFLHLTLEQKLPCAYHANPIFKGQANSQGPKSRLTMFPDIYVTGRFASTIFIVV